MIVDRVLSVLGLQRLGRFAGRWFQGAEIGRHLADWLGILATPDAELVGDFRLLVARSRDLCRNHPLAASLRRAWVDNIVGPEGLQHFPQVQNARGRLNIAANNRLRCWWKAWGRVGVPTVDGRYSRVDLERMVVDAEFVDGEFLALKIFGSTANAHGFALQLLDPQQLDASFTRAGSPGANAIRMGVEIDDASRPVAYWIFESVPGDIVPGSYQRTRIPADRVIHYFEPRRPGQTRGYPRLAPSMYRLKMLDGYEDAEVMAARIGALAALMFEQDPEHAIESLDGQVQGRVPVKWEIGMAKLLPPGVKATMLTANHPTVAFEAFTRDLRRSICAGVGVAYHTGTGDLSQSNYVSMRGGDLQQRDTYRQQQRRLAAHFTEPVYRDALKASLTFGTLDMGAKASVDWEDFAEVDFEGRGWSWTNPVQDGQAASLEIALGISTRSAKAREQGNNYEDILRERQQDDVLEEKYGQEFVDPLPQGVTESLVPGTGDTEDEATAQANATADGADAADAGDDTTTGGTNGNQP